MLLSARMLDGVGDVNTFDTVPNLKLTAGDTPVQIYFQLIDASKDTDFSEVRPAGRRYMPAVGATVSARLEHIDAAKVVTRACTQPFPQDSSIWLLTTVPADWLRGTVTLRLTVTEGDRTIKGSVRAAILIAVED